MQMKINGHLHTYDALACTTEKLQMGELFPLNWFLYALKIIIQFFIYWHFVNEWQIEREEKRKENTFLKKMLTLLKTELIRNSYLQFKFIQRITYTHTHNTHRSLIIENTGMYLLFLLNLYFLFFLIFLKHSHAYTHVNVFLRKHFCNKKISRFLSIYLSKLGQ